MITEDFPGSTLHYGPPPGHEERVGWLHVYANGLHTVSCWRPSPAEILAIMGGEPVYISHRSGCRPDTGLPLVFPVFAGLRDEVNAVIAADGAAPIPDAPKAECLLSYNSRNERNPRHGNEAYRTA